MLRRALGVCALSILILATAGCAAGPSRFSNSLEDYIQDRYIEHAPCWGAIHKERPQRVLRSAEDVAP